MIYTPFVWLLLISALINGGLAHYVRRYQGVPSVRQFRMLMWLVTAWALLYGLGIMVVNLPLRIFITHVTHIPAALSTLTSLALALEYAGRGEWLTRRRLLQLLLPPAIFLTFAFTSQFHQLWRYDYQLIRSNSIPLLIATKGAVYWVYVAYLLGQSAATFAILITSLRYEMLYFRNTVILTTGMLFPVIVGALYVFGLTPISGFDWIPTSFIFMGALYLWAILRGGLFEVVPIARNMLVENIEDLMIVLNLRGLVVDFNRAAQTALNLSPKTIGLSPLIFPQPWAGVFQNHAHTFYLKEELAAGEKIYELTISSIQDGRAQHIGRLFVFRNVTLQKQIEADERKQRALAEALRDTAEALNGTLDYDSLLEKILINVGRVVPLDSANIAMLGEDGRLNYGLFYGYEDHVGAQAELKKLTLNDSVIFKKAFESGEPLIISDTHNDPDWVIIPHSEWIRSYALMPIRIKNSVVGFLNLDGAQTGLYVPEHLNSLRAFAGQVAIATENARLFEAAQHEIAERKQAEQSLEKQNRALQILRKIALDIGSDLEMHSLLSHILNRMVELFDADRGGGIYLHDAKEQILRMAEGSEINKDRIGVTLQLNEGVAGRVFQTMQPLIVNDYTNWEGRATVLVPAPASAVLGVPLFFEGQIFGVLTMIANSARRTFTPADIQLAEMFAAQAVAAIQNAQLYEQAQREINERKLAEEKLRAANLQMETQLKQIKGLQLILREQAVRDPLTGLFNRRYLDETIERELARARRGAYPISFVMIDVDHFKQINDTYGHAAGDKVLQKLASQLLSHTRADDIICRYGGEEFLATLPKVSASVCFQIAEKWRVAFQTPDALAGHPKVTATLSCGISTYPEHGTTLEEVVANADNALYNAKAAGRNRVVIWEKDASRAQPVNDSRHK